jgi:hypothetical protein
MIKASEDKRRGVSGEAKSETLSRAFDEIARHRIASHARLTPASSGDLQYSQKSRCLKHQSK